MQNKNLVWIIVAGVIILIVAYLLGNSADMAPAPTAPATPAATEAPVSSDAVDPNANISATGAQRGAEFPGSMGDRGGQ